MRQTKIHHREECRSTHLFHFTEREERMMAYAINLSKVFMTKYGKGEKPYMIDRKHYL